jgi:hypothetical protein
MKMAHISILLAILLLGAVSCSKSNFEHQYGYLFTNASAIEVTDSNASVVAVVNNKKDMKRLVELTSLDYILDGKYLYRAGLPSQPEYIVVYRNKEPSSVNQYIWTDNNEYVYYMISMLSIYRKHDPTYCQEVRRLVENARSDKTNEPKTKGRDP